MHRAYTFRLKPTVGQAGCLGVLLAAQCELYNAALQERRGAWKWQRRQVDRFEQYRELTGFDWEPLGLFGLCVARGTLARLDQAFAGFFRRCNAGQRPGYPRFKSRSRFDSVSYPDASGWGFDPQRKRLRLMGVGTVRCLAQGPIRGVAKTITVRRRAGRWEVTVFTSKVEPEPKEPTGRVVGVDRGVAVLAATSDGELVANPRPRKSQAGRLVALQQDRARRQPGSVRYRRCGEAIARLGRKEANIRKNTAHQLSRRLVDSYDLICLEDLKINNMVRSARGSVDAPGINVAAKAGLNDAIADSGWGIMARYITYKAEDAGRCLILVDPRHTSTTCHACRYRDPASRTSQEVFCCRQCGTESHADINAAHNILRAGLAQHPGAKSDPLARAS